MACYQCGRPGGSDAQLCDYCRDKRLREDLSIETKLKHEYRFTWNKLGEILWEDIRRLSVIAVALFLGFIYYVGYSEYGPELFVPTETRLVRACRREAVILRQLNDQGIATPSDHPFLPEGVWGKALIERFGDSTAKEILISLRIGHEEDCQDVSNECRVVGAAPFCLRLFESLRAYRR